MSVIHEAVQSKLADVEQTMGFLVESAKRHESSLNVARQGLIDATAARDELQAWLDANPLPNVETPDHHPV